MRIFDDIKVYATNNPIETGIGSAVIGGSLVAGAISLSKSRKKRAKSKTKNRKMYSYTRKRKARQKKPYTAGKRKDTSKRRIRYTKNNQPYIILASGKARFISKKGVRSARKRKGGRY